MKHSCIGHCDMCSLVNNEPFPNSMYLGFWRENEEDEKNEIEMNVSSRIEEICEDITDKYTKKAPYVSDIGHVICEFSYNPVQYTRNVSVNAFRSYGDVYVIEVRLVESYNQDWKCIKCEKNRLIYSSIEEFRNSVQDVMEMVLSP